MLIGSKLVFVFGYRWKGYREVSGVLGRFVVFIVVIVLKIYLYVYKIDFIV